MKLLKNNNRANLFLLLFFIITFNIFSAEKILVRLDNPDVKTADKFMTENYDVASYFPGKHIDIIIEKSALESLQDQYPQARIIKTELQVKEDLRSKKDIAGYRSYTQTLAELQQIAADNPGICKLYNIGNSQGNLYSASGLSSYNNFNHNIWALKLSDNVEVEEDEPSFYFFGAHHAREPIGTEVSMTILNDLVDKYASDPDAQRRINNSQIWFVPVVNPDGQKVVLTEADVWWRKNIRDNNGDEQLDLAGDGVDLNRNYGFWWGPNGTSHDPSNDVYNGPEAWSEPEIQAVKSLIDSHHFVAGISYHSYSELVLYPFGYDYNAIAPDRNSLSVLCERMAASIPTQFGGYYYPAQSVDLYPTMGSTDDYAYGEYGAFGYTIELATEFIPPYSDVLTICANNLEAAGILLDRADTAMLTGSISDGVAKSPVQAIVSVTGIDNSGIYKKPYMSNEMYGRYYRFLEPGTYEITFSAYGYITQTVPGVVITSDGITDLNISLTPSNSGTVSGVVTDLASGQPVSSACIEIAEGITAFTDADGFYQADNIPYNDYKFMVSSSNYMTAYFQATVDSTAETLNFKISQGNIEDFETHDFSMFNYTFEGGTDWYISSYAPYRGSFYARSGWMEYESGFSTLVLSDSLAENGNIAFLIKMTDVETGDQCRFRIDGEIIRTWSVAKWNEVSFPVTSGYHTFKWEFYKNSSYGGDHYVSIDNIKLPKLITTGIENEQASIISDCELYQNYPNPFNPSTVIDFSLRNSDHIRLKVYNIKGELVSDLINRDLQAGRHKIMFDGRNLNSGLYFVSLETTNSTLTRSMLLLK